MIRSSFRPDLRKHCHGSKRAASGPISSRLVDGLYPDCRMTVGDLMGGSREVGETPRRIVMTILRRLKKRGYVEVDVEGRYLLTRLGRWFAISHKLGLSFIELCVLASACCIQTRYAASGKLGCYLRSSFENIFREYYSQTYILSIFASLKRKRYAVKYVKKTIRVYPKACNDLMSRYGTYFEDLESWMREIKDREIDIFSKAIEGFDWDEEPKS